MVAEYKYDPFGRRTQKLNNSTNSITKYIYDGDRIIAEYDANNNLVKKNIFGPGIDEILLTYDLQLMTTYYYHSDALGSITDITDSTGSLIEKYSYDVYGNAIIKDVNNNVLSQSSIGNRHFFTGRELDPETGLYYYRARYYSPKIGRFLQTDPVEYWDSMNLYQYCGNDPINFTDPLGLKKKEEEERRKALKLIKLLKKIAEQLQKDWERAKGQRSGMDDFIDFLDDLK